MRERGRESNIEKEREGEEEREKRGKEEGGGCERKKESERRR